MKFVQLKLQEFKLKLNFKLFNIKWKINDFLKFEIHYKLS